MLLHATQSHSLNYAFILYDSAMLSMWTSLAVLSKEQPLAGLPAAGTLTYLLYLTYSFLQFGVNPQRFITALQTGKILTGAVFLIFDFVFTQLVQAIYGEINTGMGYT